jgi:hypothetical protein
MERGLHQPPAPDEDVFNTKLKTLAAQLCGRRRFPKTQNGAGTESATLTTK